MSKLIAFLTGASKSKMVVVNTLTVVAGVVAYLIGHDVIAQNPDAVAGLVSALGAINVILRFFTVEPVSVKAKK